MKYTFYFSNEPDEPKKKPPKEDKTMISILTPLLRRIGSIAGGALIGSGMAAQQADLVINGAVALALFAMDIALSKFSLFKSWEN